MSKVLGLALLALATLGVAPQAQAAGGCGPGMHRGAWAGCRPNGGVVVVAPRVVRPVLVAPRVVVPRVCPVGFHLGPAGRACRPN